MNACYGDRAPSLQLKVRLQHAHCARNEQDHDAERDGNLDHRENFCPTREQWRVRRTERRTLGERDEEIIREAWPPSGAGELGALIVRDLHLREQKTGAAKFFLFVTHGRAAAV